MGHGTQFKDLREKFEVLSYREPPTWGWAEVRPYHGFLLFKYWTVVGSSLSSTLCAHNTVYVSQKVTKRCRLSWLTNSALVYEPKFGRERLRGLDLEYLTYDGPPMMANEWEWAFFWPIAIHQPVPWNREENKNWTKGSDPSSWGRTKSGQMRLHKTHKELVSVQHSANYEVLWKWISFSFHTVNLCLVTIKYKNPSWTNITVSQKYVFDLKE
jgi:hypothetical protein